MTKRIALLGSTGSIGTQSLEIIQQNGFEVAALTAGSNIDLLEKQIIAFSPKVVGVAGVEAARILRGRLAGMKHPPIVLEGKDAACNAVGESGATVVLNAIVGIAGLSSTLTALEAGMDVALANKESLVAGGSLVEKQQAASGASLYPVDSEHSAIFQCLQGPNAGKELRRILLTASGGPFYGKTRQQLETVTKADALRHPNWEMGAKITIDSATLMNKGLELIEAMWLFKVSPQQIEIVVQRESIIHSMVEFCDYSILAQLGAPDMRLPIQYALTWPERKPCLGTPLDFTKINQLNFGQADEETFRCLRACKKAAELGGLAPCAANGANEEAVALFLQEKISFLDIGRLVEGCVERDSYAGGYTLQDVYACDAAARRYVRENC